MKRDARAKRGFTFIELLVAFTLFSIVASSIYYTFATGVRVWKRMDAMIERTQRTRVFFDILEADLASAIPFFFLKTTTWGSQDIIFFCIATVSRGERADKELVRVRYRFEKDAGMIVSLRAGTERGFDVDSENAEKKILLSGVESMQFSYAYAKEFDAKTYEWQDSWAFKDKIPLGVKVRVTFSGDVTDAQEPVERLIVIPSGEVGMQG